MHWRFVFHRSAWRARSRFFGALLAAVLALHGLGVSRVRAGLGTLNADGTASLLYTYVTPPTNKLTAAEIAAIQTALEQASRHVCRATDGLIKINQWTIDPSLRENYADVVAHPRVDGRAHAFGPISTPGTRVQMYRDFADAQTIAHELGHYLLLLPDQYRESRRGGTALGAGACFDEEGAAFDVVQTNTQNTFMESQFALSAAGLEYQLTADPSFDRQRGNDDPNPANDEPFPIAAPTTAIMIANVSLGTGGTPDDLDTTNLQTAIDTAQDYAAFEIVDEGGVVRWANSGEDRETDVYSWGEACDFGRGSIRGWIFLEWRGGTDYALVVMAEERQFTGPDNEDCDNVEFDTIALRQLARYPLIPGVEGCGDGILQPALGEECEPTISPSTSCTTLGAFTNTNTTTCNPATCTWNRTGCHSGDPAACNPFLSQCYVGLFGELTLGACTPTGTMTCTDCLDDPAPCPHPVGSAASVVGNGTSFNVPNTAYSIANQGVAGDFTVTLTVNNVGSAGGGASTFSAPVADGTGDCELRAAELGLCNVSSCAHVCGEILSTPGNAWHMTEAHYNWRFADNGYVQALRCANRDVGQLAADPDCAAPLDYQRILSEWDVLQYNLRTLGLGPAATRQTVPLGAVGDPLTWGRTDPVVEGPDQDCTTFNVSVAVIPEIDFTTTGERDTELVLDRSGSMALPSANDPMVNRATLATNAAVAVLQMLNTADMASADVAFTTGLTSFATTPTVDAPLTALDAAGLAALTAAVGARPAPGGVTAIGDAIRTAYGEIDGNPSRDRFLLLVSDGFHNTGEAPVDATRDLMARDPRLHVCPVYFGEDADQSVELAESRRPASARCASRTPIPTTS